MVACIPSPSTGQRLNDRNGKGDLLTSQKPHNAPVSGKDSQFHQIAKHAEDLQQELLQRSKELTRYTRSQATDRCYNLAWFCESEGLTTFSSSLL